MRKAKRPVKKKKGWRIRLIARRYGGHAALRSATLLWRILTESQRKYLLKERFVSEIGRSGTRYLIHFYGPTRLFTKYGCDAACIQLYSPQVYYPPFDRMVMEILLIRNDEDRYRRTANITRYDY